MRKISSFSALFWAFFSSAVGAETVPLNIPGLAYKSAPTAANLGYVSNAMFRGGYANVVSDAVILGQSRTFPVALKAAAGAATAIGQFARFSGPVGVGLSILSMLAEHGIEAREGVWVKPNVQESFNEPGCWVMGNVCVSDTLSVVNKHIEEVNATMPRLYGDWPGGYDRAKLGATRNKSNPDIYTEYIEFEIWIKNCNVFHVPNCGDFAPAYTMTASKTSPPPTPYYSPASDADFNNINGTVTDEVLNEAQRLGIPLPVEAPSGIDFTVSGTPYIPDGATTPVIPTAQVTSGAPGYLNITYNNAPAGTQNNTDGTTTTTTNTTGGTSTNSTTNNYSTTNNSTTNNTTNTTNNSTTNNTTTTNITNNYDNPASEELPDLCEKNPNALACQEMGEPPDEDISKSTKDFTVAPISLGLPSGCPAPRFALDIEFSFQPVCDAAPMIRPLVVAAGIFAAFMIVLGAIRS